MAEENESVIGRGQQEQPAAAAQAQTKLASRPAVEVKAPVDDRDEFIRNALPVAAALRRAGNPEEAKKLELVANALLQTKSMERAPAQAPAPAKEETIKDLLASVYKTIDQNPALKNMPEARDMRRAGNKLDEDGMLNISVRNGVVTSFVSNFTDNFGRTQQLGEAGANRTTQDETGRINARPREAAGLTQPYAATPTTPGLAQPATPTPARESLPPALAAEAPSAAKPAASVPITPTPQAAPLVAPLVAPKAIAPVVTAALGMPAPASGPSEIRYATAPPDSDGLLSSRVLSERAAHNALFQLVVDARDPNRAVLLPAPGADARLISSLQDAMPNAFAQRGLPEANKPYLAVETPAQLTRTESGWRVVEKGAVGFSESPAPYQAQQPAPVQQPPQQAAQGLAGTARVIENARRAVTASTASAAPPAPATPFTRADISAEELAKVGVQVADLEKSGQLQKLLAGKKTDLLPFVLPTSDGVAVPFAAKLVLHRDAQGVASLRVDLPKHELEIPRQIMGKAITPAMQVQLQANGVVPLAEGFQDGQGQPFAAYLAVDKEMKRVVAVPRAGITVPKEVRGVQLNPEQSKQLLEGRPTRIQGMTNTKQQLVDATVQLDPLARKLVFRDAQPRVAPEQTKTQDQEPGRRRGVRV